MSDLFSHKELIEKVFNQDNLSVLWDIKISNPAPNTFLLVNNYGYLYSLKDLEAFQNELHLLQTALSSHKAFMQSKGLDIAEDFNNEKRELMEQEEIKRRLNFPKALKQVKTFVYLMANSRNGLYKIGRSKNPQYREHTLASQEPEINTIHTFRGTTQSETDLHTLFKSKRVRGEWFSLNEDDVNYIKTITDKSDE